MLVLLVATCARTYVAIGRIEKQVSAVSDSVGKAQTDIHELKGDVSKSLGNLDTALDDAHQLIPAVTATANAATNTIDQSRPKLLAAIDSANTLLGSANETVAFAKPKIGTALDRTNRFLLEADTGSAAIRKQELANAQTLDASGKQFLLFLGKLNGIADHTDSAILHGDKILANGEKISNRLAQPVTTTKRVISFAWNSFLHWFGAK